MNWLEAALLGIVQGLTEFFPVSSSGHLVIGETLLGAVGEGIAFEIAVHIGTLFAILVYYRKRVAELVVGVLKREAEALHYAAKLVLATLPAVAVGLTVKDEVEAMFDYPWITGVALLVTGGLLWTTRTSVARATAAAPSYAQALVIGLAQVFAITPGISRSGTTVAVGLLLGVQALAATEFSFMLGVIAITGAAVLAAPDLLTASGEATGSFWVGGVCALGSGLFAIRWFVQLLESQRFHLFSAYCWTAGLVFLGYLAIR